MSTQPGVVPAGCGQSVLREHEGLPVLLDAGAPLDAPDVAPRADDDVTNDVAALLVPTVAEVDGLLAPEDPPVALDVPALEVPRDDVTLLVLVGPLVPPLPGRDVAVLEVAALDVAAPEVAVPEVPAADVPPLDDATPPPLEVPLVTVTAHAPSTHWRPSSQSLSWEHRAAGSSCAHPDATDITTARQAAPRILGPS